MATIPKATEVPFLRATVAGECKDSKVYRVEGSGLLFRSMKRERRSGVKCAEGRIVAAVDDDLMQIVELAEWEAFEELRGELDAIASENHEALMEAIQQHAGATP